MSSWFSRFKKSSKRSKSGKREMKKIEGLALYHYDACPFCMRVRMTLSSLAIEVELRDTRDSTEYAQEVRAATGQGTVPVLRIEEGETVRWLSESAEIVAYLRQRFA